MLSRMREQGKPFHYTVTATTRRQRSSEVDGTHYIFVTDDRFQEMIDSGELLEWAEVYGNRYGVPRDQVVQALENGEDVIIKTDIQGAATIRKIAAEAVFIFLAPPSMEVLASRLAQRMTEPPDALNLRLRTAEAEMAAASDFDHVVINNTGRLDEAIQQIVDIAARERVRQPRRRVTL